jgi:DNA repair exonuclease SbcCD ATPase subunit
MIARAKLAESELAIREATDSFRAVEAWKSRQARAKDLIRSAFDLKKKLPEEIPDDLPTHEEVDAYRVRVANAETSHRIRLGEEASLKAEVKRLETRRAELVAEARKTSGLRDEFDATKALAWALREVQIAEIDLAGPMIADTANDLLRSCYGTRFQIRIKTQSEKKTGGIKDDFDVEVWDERIGKAQSIDGVSGGEQVVIDEVLRNALALFARKRSGCPVETLWRDEVFASLYPPNDQLYVQMLHRVRNLGGFYQIFYVASEDMARSADAEIHLVGDGTVQIRR